MIKQDRFTKNLKRATLTIMYILLVAQVIMFKVLDISSKPEPLVNYVVTFIILAMISILTGHYFSAIPDYTRPNMYYYGILVVLYIYTFLHTVNYSFPIDPDYIFSRNLVMMLVYLFGLMLTATYSLYFVKFFSLSEEKKVFIRKILMISYVFFSLVALTNPITKVIFEVSPEGKVVYSETYAIMNVYPMSLFFIEIYYIIKSDQDRATKRALMAYCISAVFFIAIDFIPQGENDITIDSGIALGGMCSIYIVFLQVYVQNAIELSKKSIELQEKQTQIMVSQIQPHFMYNTLTAIHVLCEEDPKLAQKTIQDFSAYLRHNMESLNSVNCVPFEQELEHTKIYLEIESLRFSDILKIEYDIQCTDFLLPALSLQPIVENAVKYGIRSREDGGTVTIKTYRKGEKVYVVIHDDGMGFSPDELKNDNRTHIGIENTKKRIESMCNGEMKIESTESEGTTVTIIIDGKE